MNEFAHFVLVGAQRCGTTYLYHVLNEHPQIEMATPIKPEPKFFLAEDALTRGAAYYEATYFHGKPGVTLRGEKSTSYIEYELAAQQIAALFPQARIVITLRNPVDRALSNYWFSVNNGIETLPLENAFWQEETRREDYDRARFSVSPYAYLQRGLYSDYLSLYERYFAPEQITVLVFEQVLAAPERAISTLYAALDVRADFVPPSIRHRINESRRADERPLSPALRQYLAGYFAESNARLADRLQFDLGQWGWDVEGW